MLIDIHGHIGRITPDRREFIDFSNLIAKMDAWGIETTCVLPVSEHPEGGYLECDTEDVIRECSRRPDRLVPFCLIDPRHGNRPDADFSHLLGEYTARGCKGVGEFLPKLDFDDPLCLNLYRQAGEFGLPVLFDMADTEHGYGLRDDPGLPKLENALKNFPATTFIGHGPTFWAEVSGLAGIENRTGYPVGPVRAGGAVPRLMRLYPNLWADISARSGYNALSRDRGFSLEFLEEFQDRVMFGTDSCRRSDVNSIQPNAAFLRELRCSGSLPPAVLQKIESSNCLELLNPGKNVPG